MNLLTKATLTAVLVPGFSAPDLAQEYKPEGWENVSHKTKPDRHDRVLFQCFASVQLHFIRLTVTCATGFFQS